MKHASLLIPDGQSSLSTIACLAGTVEIFAEANRFQEQLGKPAAIHLQTVAASKEAAEIFSFAIKPDACLNDIKKTDLILIPSAKLREHEQASNGNLALINWTSEQYKLGAEVASMCSGAFLLAATGILDGKECSTHWSLQDKLRETYPQVKVRTERLITDEGGVYTNGGAYSFLNLVLYLIEKFYDRATAIHCSKIFQIELDRNTQSIFSIFNGHKQHEDSEVLKAQTYIETNYQEKISVETLCNEHHLSRRNFDRRFIKATGLTPLDYVQRVKIEAAKKSLETTRKNVNEVMYEVGYNDTKAFREVFSRVTGMSPTEYKNRYHKFA